MVLFLMQFRSKPVLSDFFLTRTYQIYAPNEQLHAAVSPRRDQAAADYRRHHSRERERLTSVTGLFPKSSNSTRHPPRMDPTTESQPSSDQSRNP